MQVPDHAAAPRPGRLYHDMIYYNIPYYTMLLLRYTVV